MPKNPGKKANQNSVGFTALNFIGAQNNFLGAIIGGWGPFYSKKTLNKLAPAEQASLIKDYYKSMGFDSEKVTTLIPKTDGFDAYVLSRIKTLGDFTKIKALSDFKVQLPDTDADSVRAKNAIADALTLDDKTTAASKKFKQEMSAVAEVLKDPKALYSPETMLTHMHKLHSTAQAAMKEQHKLEIDKLGKALDAHADTLKKQLQLSDQQYNEMKIEMIKTLSDSHKKGLSEFDKLITEPLKKMHELSKLEMERLLYMSTLHEHNKTMRAEIERLYMENKPQDGTVVAQMNNDEKGAMFKGLKPSDLKTLQTITGRNITTEKTPDGVTFTMSFPNRMNIAYHYSAEEKKKADWMGLAGAVRASGHDSITLKFSHGKDEQYAMKQGRLAFEAARENGFDLSKITIEVNGKSYTGDKIQSELFKDDPTSYARIDGLAETAKKAREEALKESKTATQSEVNSQAFKDTLSKGRESALNKAKPAADDAAAPTSPAP